MGLDKFSPPAPAVRVTPAPPVIVPVDIELPNVATSLLKLPSVIVVPVDVKLPMPLNVRFFTPIAAGSGSVLEAFRSLLTNTSAVKLGSPIVTLLAIIWLSVALVMFKPGPGVSPTVMLVPKKKLLAMITFLVAGV